jgi:hypothetical protein
MNLFFVLDAFSPNFGIFVGSLLPLRIMSTLNLESSVLSLLLPFLQEPSHLPSLLILGSAGPLLGASVSWNLICRSPASSSSPRPLSKGLGPSSVPRVA